MRWQWPMSAFAWYIAARIAAAATRGRRGSAIVWQRGSTRSSRWMRIFRTTLAISRNCSMRQKRGTFVIGSRAVQGGGERGRGLARRLLTTCAAAYVKAMLGLRGIRDPTSGYRCFRRRVLAGIHLETLSSPGPGIVTEVLYRCRRFRIREIPIVFRERERGASKFGLRAMWESLLLAARLRLRGR